jgi:hypothetical protein
MPYLLSTIAARSPKYLGPREENHSLSFNYAFSFSYAKTGQNRNASGDPVARFHLDAQSRSLGQHDRDE